MADDTDQQPVLTPVVYDPFASNWRASTNIEDARSEPTVQKFYDNAVGNLTGRWRNPVDGSTAQQSGMFKTALSSPDLPETTTDPLAASAGYNAISQAADPFDPVTTPNLNSALPPQAMRNVGASVAGGLGRAVGNVLSIPQRAFEASENLRTTGDYDPAPVVQAATLGMGAAAPFAEEGAAGIFGGRLAAQNLAAKGIDEPSLALKVADHMDARGATADDIYKVTSKMLEGTPYAGVSKGAEGKWRFEIPDNEMSVTPGQGYWGQNIDHPSFFQSYPNLNEREANFDYGDSLGAYRHFDSRMNVTAPTRDEMASVASHEMQHGTQKEEGFTSGSSPATSDEHIFNEINPRLLAIAKQMHGTDIGDPNREVLKAAYDALLSQRANVDRYDLYKRTAGEVEARNVQTRLNMTPEERRASAPWTTEDVPRDQQIVRTGGNGMQASIEKGSLGQGDQPPLGAQPKPTSPEALSKSNSGPAGLSSVDFMGEIQRRLADAGYHVFAPPNPNSLSRYLSVGNKSEFHKGVDAVGAVRIRAADHEGYGADFDLRPNSTGRYDSDPATIVNSVVKKLANNGVTPRLKTEDVPRDQQIVRGVQLTPVPGDPFAPGKATGGAVKSTKTETHYRKGQGKTKCLNCTMFRPPHECTAVQGVISPAGVCDLFEAKKEEGPKIVRKYDVPYLAGSSNDDKTVYIDRRVPKTIAVKRANGKGRVSIDPAEFLAAHEIAEHKAMRAGKSYEKAHIEDGTAAERALVKERGLDWRNYEAIMDGLLSHIEHEKPKFPPPDLYTKPYPHDKAKLLEKLGSREGGAH